MKGIISFAVIITAFFFLSACEKISNSEPNREVIPVNYYSNRILTSVEDGVWIERTVTTYDSLLMTRNVPCLNPLSESSTKYFKYNFNGQLTDSLAELPQGILSTNYYGSKLIEDIFLIKNVSNRVFDITVFGNNLQPSTTFRLDIANELPENSYVSPPPEKFSL
jgi:hypothetical protein